MGRVRRREEFRASKAASDQTRKNPPEPGSEPESDRGLEFHLCAPRQRRTSGLTPVLAAGSRLTKHSGATMEKRLP